MTDELFQVFASVWDALAETPEEAPDMRLRSALAVAVRSAVEAWQVTQGEAARRLGVTQPRMNDLLRGAVDRFSLDDLMSLAERAGLSVRLEIGRDGA